jgi:hypothetical protein
MSLQTLVNAVVSGIVSQGCCSDRKLDDKEDTDTDCIEAEELLQHVLSSAKQEEVNCITRIAFALSLLSF